MSNIGGYKKLLAEDPEEFKRQLQEAERAVVQLARKDPAVFCQYVLRDERSGKPVKLSKIHREFHRIAVDNKRSVIWSHPESGKDLNIEESIPTFGGYLNVRDIKVGDTVFGSDGKPVLVTGVTEVFKDMDTYRVTFDDGSYVEAGKGHVWKTKNRQDRHLHRGHRTETTEEMAKRVKLSDGRCNWSVPLCTAVEYSEKDLPLDPYTLGAWLGDGDSGSPKITSHEKDVEIFNYIETKHPGGKMFWDKRKPHILRPRIGAVRTITPILNKLHVLNNKHIPEIYKQGSVQQRRDLLAGLLDTDGSVNNSQVEFCNMNERLANDVLELVRSLGIKARLKTGEAKCKGKSYGIKYRVFFTPKEQVFKLKRKQDALLAQMKKDNSGSNDIKYVTAIDYIGKKQTKCISVDNTDHTFLVGRHYTVTHNCEVTGSKVLLADGTWTNIESINEEVEILAFDPKTLRFKKCKAGPVEDNGVRPVIKFVTDTGEVITVTFEHPIATQRGWVMAKDITTSDKILNVVRTPTNYVPGYGDYLIEDAHTLGWLLHSATPQYVTNKIEGMYWAQSYSPGRKAFTYLGGKDKRSFHPEMIAIGKLVNDRLMSNKKLVSRNNGSSCRWTIKDKNIQQLYLRNMLVKDTPRGNAKASEFQEHVFRAPMDWQVQLLRGLLAGVSAHPQKRKSKEVVHRGLMYASGLPKSINSHNYKLMLSIKLLMANLGFPCTMRAHSDASHLDVSGTRYRHLEISEDVSRHILEVCKNGWKPYGGPAVRMSEIVSIVKPSGSSGSKTNKKSHKQTWALPVHDDCHCYISGCVVSHNTNQISIGHTLWKLGNDPNMCILVVSNTKDQAGKIITAMKNYIVNSRELHKVFPNLRPGRKWSEHSFSVVRPFERAQPSVIACGIKASIMGFRANYLILDDVDDMESTLTESSRADTLRWIQSTPFSRLSEDAGVFAIGNVWHESDLLHTLAKKEGWFSKKFPVLDEFGRPTWPEKFSEERLETIKIDSGPLEFARLYMCEPRADGQQRFRREWLELCCENGEGRIPLESIDNLPRGYACFTGVDIGHRVKLGSDPTAITTIIANRDGDYEVIDVEAGLWDVMSIAEKIRDKQRRYNSTVYVESNGAQEFLVQILKTTGERIPVKPFITGKNKHDPKYGIESIAAEMATGKWTIPSALGTIESTTKEMHLLIDGLLAYDPNPRVHTADRVMSLWIAREAARQEQTRPKGQMGRINLTTR